MRAPSQLEKKTVRQLMRKLDEVMSRWVRRNWSADGIYVKCFTCDKPMLIKEAHSGHYIPRTQSPTRYDERNQRPQCPGCNTFRSGMPHEFRARLVDEIGADEVESLEALSRRPWKWSREYLINKIRDLTEQLEVME